MADQQVTYSIKTWLAKVLKADKDHYKDDVAYEFNDGHRKFKSTDRYDTGFYDGA